MAAEGCSGVLPIIEKPMKTESPLYDNLQDALTHIEVQDQAMKKLIAQLQALKRELDKLNKLKTK